METTIIALQQLEERSKQWRKHYEDEEKRIEAEYERELAEIERAYKEAARKIRMDFHARREAVKRQHNGEDVREKQPVKSSQKIACNTAQHCRIAPYHRQSSAPRTDSICISVQQRRSQIIPSKAARLTASLHTPPASRVLTLFTRNGNYRSSDNLNL